MASAPSPYPEGLESGEIRYQRCAACGAPQTLERCACTSCGDTRLEWRSAAGTGTVYAKTEVMRAPSEVFKPLVPYTLVLVDLEEGARLMAHADAGVAIGDRVRADIFSHAGRNLVRFRRVP